MEVELTARWMEESSERCFSADWVSGHELLRIDRL